MTMESALGAELWKTQPSAASLRHLTVFSEKGGSPNSSRPQTAACYKQLPPTNSFHPGLLNRYAVLRLLPKAGSI